MKKNDKDQIKSTTLKELVKKVTDLKKQISDEILKRQSANVKNVHVVKNLRHALAVAESVKRAKELVEERKNV